MPQGQEMVQRALSNTLYDSIGLHFAMAVNGNHYADESQGAGRISNLNLSIVSGPGNDIAATLQ